MIQPIRYNWGKANVYMLIDANRYCTKLAKETYNPLDMMGPAKGMLRRTLEDAVRQAEEWITALLNLEKL